jgi:hypothetical protein
MHSLNLRQRQRGATFLGMVVILGILAAGLYAAIRLVPLYLDYTKVARALEQVRDEHSSIDTSKQMIRSSLERRWDVEDIKGLFWKEVEITNGDGGFDVRAAYRAEAPFVANVSLAVDFDKTVHIPQ